MSYVLESPNPLFNIKLTEYARQQLALGQLNFAYYAFTDSEIDYTFGNESTRTIPYDLTKNRILSPKDRNDIHTNLFLFPGLSGGTTIQENVLAFSSARVNIRNDAEERGFFTASTTASTVRDVLKTDTTYFLQANVQTYTSAMTGTNILSLTTTGTPTNTSYIPLSGDRIMITIRPPQSESLGDTVLGSFSTQNPFQNLIYQIESVTGTTFSGSGIQVQVDRNLPNFSGYTGSLLTQAYFFPGANAIQNFYGSADTTSYWDSDLLSFDNNCIQAVDDVPVLNYNIVYEESIIGTSANTNEEYVDYGSAIYNGSDWFFNGAVFPRGEYRPKAYIHYTNNSISNYYGEFLIPDTVKVHLPQVMYHLGSLSGMGITLTGTTAFAPQRLFQRVTTNAGTGNNVVLDLNDNTNGRVGWIFPNQKVIQIHDWEIVASTSYKSDRTYTLPRHSLVKLPVPSGGLITTGQTFWCTYMFYNPSAYTNATSAFTYGMNGGLPQQNVQKTFIDGTIASPEFSPPFIDVQLRFPNEFPFMKGPNELDGTGWNGQRLLAIMQITSSSSLAGNEISNPSNSNFILPSENGWKVLDITDKIFNYDSFSATTIPPSALTASTSPQFLTITAADYAAATDFKLDDYGFSLPATNAQDRLGFGDEEVLLGNLETRIGATIQRTEFICQAPQNRFNSSQNTTWTPGNSVYITGALLFDTNNNVVGVGKPNRPIEKDSTKPIIVRLALDF